MRKFSIKEMTLDEYKNGGANLTISYRLTQSPFGKILIASTQKGICYLGFTTKEDDARHLLQTRFPQAVLKKQHDQLQQDALSFFTHGGRRSSKTKLHLKGTPFQMKVWKALLEIPTGQLSTYKGIATHIAHPHAWRAVGTAVGYNPVAFLIPCHRVIPSSGKIGNYHWGQERKIAILDWEGAQRDALYKTRDL